MKFDVVLLPSFAQVESWRKQHAQQGRAGLFSCAVTTFNAWIADLWELHGDGRAIADSLQRHTVMQAAFEASGESEAQGDADDAVRAMAPSPGVVKLASQCVREAAGVPAFEHAVDCALAGLPVDGLAQRELEFLEGIGRYRALLEKAGLIEVGLAAALLAASSTRVFARPLDVLVAQAAPLDWRMKSFFDACDNIALTVEEAPGAEGVSRMPEGVGLRFGFPSGRYAQPGLVADLVREHLADAGGRSCAGDSGTAGAIDMVVACKDPLALYKQLEAPLAKAGALPSVQAQVPFSSTDFGRQFMALGRVLDGEMWSKEDLSDAVRPPFSGFSAQEAVQVDRELRANRLAERDDSLARLRVASEVFSQLEELASDPEADILLGVFEQIAFTSPGRSDAWRLEQLSAASAVRSCTRAARAVGASMRSCMRVLEDVQVTVSYEGAALQGAYGAAPEGEALAYGGHPDESVSHRVVFTTQSVAAQMGAASCATLVLCDLTSEDYPIADRDDAAATLFAKLGLLPIEAMLARSRRTFAALQVLPASQLVCLRPLNDWDGNPTYPSAMLQELVDAYRPNASYDGDDVDELFGLPAVLRADVVQRGEEDLYANASALPGSTAQPIEAIVPSGHPGDISNNKDKIALSRRLPDGGVLDAFSPSPSQVEAYLECPYKWFAQRRLGIEELDEGFGSLERGLFAHAVLQKFYQAFGEKGFAKVDSSNLEYAKELMSDIADEEELAQRDREPGSGRYVAADQIEQRELASCKDQLISYLDFEAAFLPRFHPAYFEYTIGLEAGISYAGRPFVGMVDRIDVDDEGNAVIIDYKGSVGAAHEIAGKGPSLPGKVQTRMYARAVERALGLRVVGALYVSYGASRGCAGAFDGRALEAAHLPNMRVDRCSCALDNASGSSSDVESVEDFSQLTFADMLDSTEKLVADAIDAMERGDVQPRPSSAEACQYCPVANCLERV